MSATDYISLVEFNKSLPTETAEKFKVIGLDKQTSKRIVFAKFGTVDFTTLTVDIATILVKKGFPYLEVKPAKKSKSSEE